MFYYDSLPYKKWTYYFVVSHKGLVAVDITDHDVKKYDAVLNEQLVAPYKKQFQDFFEGRSQTFHLPLDLEGTDFQKMVWSALQQIPFGEITTYSDLAKKINRPNSTRAVANAIGKNPVLILVPCHRVIGKDGTLTGFSSGLDLKKDLLAFEGNFFEK